MSSVIVSPVSRLSAMAVPVLALSNLWFFSTSFRKLRFVNLFFDEVFYFFEEHHVFGRDKSDGFAGPVGPRRTSYAVHVVFGVAWHVVVDHQLDIVDVYASAHDICRDEDVDLSVSEFVHDFITFLLGEVRMHAANCTSLQFESPGEFFHLGLFGCKDNDAVEVFRLERLAQNVVFHLLMADVGRLLDFLSGF